MIKDPGGTEGLRFFRQGEFAPRKHRNFRLFYGIQGSGIPKKGVLRGFGIRQGYGKSLWSTAEAFPKEEPIIGSRNENPVMAGDGTLP
jgi:hypothetical protein